MKRLISAVSITVLAFGLTPGALAQIDGGKSGASPLPSFRDLPRWDPNYRAPRTPDGKPDLQGVWSSASLTQLSRPAGATIRGGYKIDTLVIPDDQVQKYIAENGLTKEYKKQAYTDPSTGAGNGVGDGRGGENGTGTDIRGYNYFWLDPGSEYGRVNGEWRSSWIVSPANGQIPYSKEGATARASRAASARKSGNTGPEVRTLSDRCLVFGQQAGPPLSNTLYNNNYQIIQTPSNVVINSEMVHDTRIVRINGAAKPDAIKPWFGDSIGHWEGETLVIETRNLNPVQGASGQVPLSDKGKVTERFTRKSDVEILYEFSVDDPVNYTQVWKGEMPLRLSKERLYEYACAEGNYALEGILRGDAMGIDTAIDKESEG